jgi:hypothetical protein
VSASCQITVTYAASTSGGATGSLMITDNDSTSTQAAALSASSSGFTPQLANGTGGTATISAGSSAVFSLSIVPDQFQGTFSITCTGAPPSGSYMHPNSAVISNNLPATIQVTVTTQGTGTFGRRGPSPGNSKRPLVTLPMFSALALLVALIPFVRSDQGPKILRCLRPVCVMTFVLASLVLASCGGGGAVVAPAVVAAAVRHQDPTPSW